MKIESKNYGDLLDSVKAELMRCACPDTALDVLLDSELYDDEGSVSVLVSVQFKPFNCDDGRVVPPPVTLEFRYDKANSEWSLMTGEDAENRITYGNLFASMYFNTLEVEGAANERGLDIHDWCVTHGFDASADGESVLVVPVELVKRLFAGKKLVDAGAMVLSVEDAECVRDAMHGQRASFGTEEECAAKKRLSGAIELARGKNGQG